MARSYYGNATDDVLATSYAAPPGAPWHFLYFLPDPQGQGSFRLMSDSELRAAVTVVDGVALLNCRRPVVVTFERMAGTAAATAA